MLHQDGSRATWLAGRPQLDLIVTMDDATSTIYSAFLVEEEGTASTFRALVEVFTADGLPSSLHTDRGSHYFHTPEADVRHPAGPADQRAGEGGNPRDRRRQCLDPGRLPARPQCAVRHAGRACRDRLRGGRSGRQYKPEL
jgi:hypothetical protein